MSLFGYKPKTKPANWTTVPGAVTEHKHVPVAWKPHKFRNRIRSVSAVQEVRNRIYNHRVRIWKKGKCCAAWCSLMGVKRPCSDNHHIRGKVGPLLLDERYWLPVCRTCHIKMDLPNFRTEAIKRGWLAGPGEWNKTT